MPDDRSKRQIRQFRDLDETDFKIGSVYDRSSPLAQQSVIKRDMNGFPETSIFYQPTLAAAGSTGGDVSSQAATAATSGSLSQRSSSANTIQAASSLYFEAPSDFGSLSNCINDRGKYST